MDKTLIMAFLLGVLLIVSAAQAVQIAGITAQIKASGLQTTGLATGGGGQQAQGSGSLPQMVGGC